MKKNIIFMMVACFGLVLTMSSYKQDKAKGPKEFKGFKNLTVLPKDISRDSLHNLMEEYNMALGVSCGYCHAKDESTGRMDFASDTKKEKGFAREMISMTKRINEKDFAFIKPEHPDQVTIIKCGTCHRGSAEPTEYTGVGSDEKK